MQLAIVLSLAATLGTATGSVVFGEHLDTAPAALAAELLSC